MSEPANEMRAPLLPEKKVADERHERTGSGTPLSTALNLAATSMGTGLLTLPHTFARCGPLVGTGLLAVLSVTTDVTLILLVKMSRALGVHTFGALMRKLFGKGGSAVFQLTLISVLFLALTAMQRVVLDLLPIFLESICGVEHGTVKPLALSMVVNLFVIAACCSKNYHSLRFTSGAALLCLVPFVLALWRNTLRPDRPEPRPTSESISWEGFLLASPILASSLAGGHFSVMDMAAQLQPRYKESIYSVIHVVFLIVIPLCYVSVSWAGVELFGADTPEDILVEFKGDSAMEVARGVLSFTNALRMPLILMPLHTLVVDTLHLLSASSKEHEPPLLQAWRLVFGMPLLLLSSAVLAQWLSTLASILGLLGGTGGVIGCFCVPGAMYLKVHYKKEAKSSSAYAICAAMAIVIGLAVVVSCCLSWVQ
ncbi:unnamed protein product [Effrenium voratum]|uniref:Amino acid transporter transmembrane domain-containing protein n=1 Tax=Effrenium voratum TaxID=2562239 RepID=A0AA36JLU8_9DINO|nr:unnamed protein product [Effrenium voratum]CAJ1442357.1 unnamed protein product [Effrenium voratum]CAJ1460866.1 unnamed protein product [Effrenium voratum]